MKRILINILILLTVTTISYANNATKETIIIGATDWIPYTSKKLNSGGFLTEIYQTALEKAGYKTKIKFLPWKRAVSATKSGKIHALIGLSYTKERTQYFSYPKNHWKSIIYLYSNKGHKYNNKTLKELCPSKVGMFLGSFMKKDFESYNCFKIEEVKDSSLNIKKLSKNRIDFFVAFKDSIMYKLNNNLHKYNDIIEKVTPAYGTDKVYMAFSKKLKNYKQIQKDFDNAMDTMKKDGSYDKILLKHGMK